jgi:hypothetical protein
MYGDRLAGVMLLGLALAAQAQTAATGIQESTDPAKAAAVERAAAALQSRPPQPEVGLVRAKTAGGHEILSGGVTVSDRITMHAELERYSLWVATVAKPSGAYLLDADLRIVDLKSKTVVLERKMEGPWIFLALPEWPYEVSATFRDAGAEKAQTLSTRVSIPKKGQRQAVLRFDATASVDPDMQGPLRGNPFGMPAPPK